MILYFFIDVGKSFKLFETFRELYGKILSGMTFIIEELFPKAIK